MLRVLGVAFLLGLIVLAAGAFFGWFSITHVEGRDRTSIDFTVNKDALREDAAEVQRKVKDIGKDTGFLRAEGKLIHAGRSTAVAEGRLVDEAGKLYAHATTTCMILRP